MTSRIWAGTVLATLALQECERFTSEAEAEAEHALRLRADSALAVDLKHLRPEEAAVLVLLRGRLSREQSARQGRWRTD